MRRVAVAFAGIWASLACAFAAGYDDFARGMTAVNAGDNDTAIASFSSALSAGDLNPTLQPIAHYERAIAYLRKEQCALAGSDADAALQAKPDYVNARLVQAQAKMCAGDFNGAIAAYSDVLARNGAPADAYYARGLLYWSQGRLEESASDFRHLTATMPRNGYVFLWLANVMTRHGEASGAVSDALAGYRGEGWPAPLVRLYQGRSTPEQVVAAIGQGSPTLASNQRCEADFFIAEWHLMRSDGGDVKGLLDSAVANCPHGFSEYRMAKFERARLKT